MQKDWRDPTIMTDLPPERIAPLRRRERKSDLLWAVVGGSLLVAIVAFSASGFFI